MTDQEELTAVARLELFGGTPSKFGGLSNERELARYVPVEFKKGNRWTDRAGMIFFKGADTSKWNWKTQDATERKRQMACLRALLTGWELPHEQKESVAGWMLSEMLTDVPS